MNNAPKDVAAEVIARTTGALLRKERGEWGEKESRGGVCGGREKEEEEEEEEDER